MVRGNVTDEGRNNICGGSKLLVVHPGDVEKSQEENLIVTTLISKCIS